MLARLKSDVAREIELFFNEAASLTVNAQYYVRSLFELTQETEEKCIRLDIEFKVCRSIEKQADFLTVRDRLSKMSVEVHRISGRHYSMLSTMVGATTALEDCAKAFSEITELMWIRLPLTSLNSPINIEKYVNQIDKKACASFIECCNRNYSYMNGISGGLSGSLLAKIVGINFSTLLSLKGKRDKFLEALNAVQRRSNK